MYKGTEVRDSLGRSGSRREIRLSVIAVLNIEKSQKHRRS